MASLLVEEVRNPVTIATLRRHVPFNVFSVTMGDEQPWLHPSPGLWRMRRAEVVTVSVVLAAFFGLLFLAAVSPLAGLVSALVVATLGTVLSWFLRRRFRAWRYQERHEDLIVARGVMVQRLTVVPYGRIQAVRQVEPLLWRPFGWCRLEVEVAGATERNQPG
jgi:uncharacterized protein